MGLPSASDQTRYPCVRPFLAHVHLLPHTLTHTLGLAPPSHTPWGAGGRSTLAVPRSVLEVGALRPCSVAPTIWGTPPYTLHSWALSSSMSRQGGRAPRVGTTLLFAHGCLPGSLDRACACVSPFLLLKELWGTDGHVRGRAPCQLGSPARLT